jgi:hypothetical protein
MRDAQRIVAFVFTAAAALWFATGAADAQTAEEPPLQLEAKIPLGDVSGRIDHMAIDPTRHRLFVAELGNDTVGVVDLKQRKVVHVVAGLKEPQGVGYVPSSDTLYVANARDGSVQLFKGEDYAAAGRIDLGDDADNIRVDTAANRLFIGYGGGALAVIDPASRSKVAEIPLNAHPEGFQLSTASPRIFVNVTNSRAIAVVDRDAGQVTANWPLKRASANFPMALDEASGHVIVVFRNPAILGVFDMQTGASVAERDTCGDSDDVFFDAKRKRVYVSCGAGFVDAFDATAGTYRHLARIRTIAGARTSLFLPEDDRYVVAARAHGKEPAALWLYRPMP